ncbi:NiFe hydrogenase [Shewanella ulleungensis]|uniref:NiFe hydrogenase assembly chaperone HyaE n=1 Tax=Shewanella ulleungensis TaxID=2282699 RepID=A0ABQ2QE45_9GAMM|nr:NiFe hydrogenase [Shewanella ulleungensis]MCL1148716.1 NiFe hydrogenase [Shewanella ulleungensis]GGP76029.1 NiFe hydrogenase assembly chaperone HyaE [Shewanella ulleungensis]
MSMHNIRFDFICQRPVPLYKHLCNEYLQRTELAISIGIEHQQNNDTICYFIEACAQQAELEALADDIANDFLLSVWLQKTEIKRINHKTGQTKPFEVKQHQGLPLYFCQHCQPQLGDNQHPHFGDINLVCEHCKGHYKLSRELKSLTHLDIAAMANNLLSEKTLALPMLGITLALSAGNKQTQYRRPRILVCNPNSLNSQFCVTDSQVLALSSIEKPLLRVRPCSDHPSLHAPLYEIQFAENRLLVILTEMLRQKGVHWLYVNQDEVDNTKMNLPLRLASISHYWLPITTLTDGNIPLPNNLTCLHDENNYKTSKYKFLVKSTKHLLEWHVVTLPKLSQVTISQTQPTKTMLDSERHSPLEHAIDKGEPGKDISNSLCALSAGLLRHNINEHHAKALFVKNAAILYFNKHHPSQIVTVDGHSEAELFFELPMLPSTGYEVCHKLSDSPQKNVLDKFKQLHPREYNQLLDLQLSPSDGALSQLMAVAALIIGAGPNQDKHSKQMCVSAMADKFIALAMSYQGNNAPRIDFPLTKGMAHRSLNWCKTLGSLMSFKLAGDANLAKLAFAFHDSFADYLSHWIEHVDQNIGIKQLVVAGNEFANPVLAERVQLRIGKNFPLVVNPLLDLDGVNIAIGGLYLKQRRG